MEAAEHKVQQKRILFQDFKEQMESYQAQKIQQKEQEKLADKMLLEANMQKNELVAQQIQAPPSPEPEEDPIKRKIIEEEKQKVWVCGLDAHW